MITVVRVVNKPISRISAGASLDQQLKTLVLEPLTRLNLEPSSII
jgi:hypothetical protein